ncbi:MAG: DUF4054 domain-containing protein [Desulfobacteraceae bacterium]|nr:DUF4054 domain-containing protein [Desulfobacteraceae bacterium]
MSDAILDAITAITFREYFTRDFKYLPTYKADTTYFSGDQVWYLTNFYECIVTSSLGVLPTDPTNWKAVNLSQSNYVLDSDINKSLAQALGFVNPAIFESDAVKSDAFLYCTAHYMVMDIRMAESGLDSRGEGVVSSKGVGSVSVSYSLPAAFTNDPTWNYFAQTEYGKKYLSYVIPRLTGLPGIAVGGTRA